MLRPEKRQGDFSHRTGERRVVDGRPDPVPDFNRRLAVPGPGDLVRHFLERLPRHLAGLVREGADRPAEAGSAGSVLRLTMVCRSETSVQPTGIGSTP